MCSVFGILKYVRDIVVTSSRSLSHLLISSCLLHLHTPVFANGQWLHRKIGSRVITNGRSGHVSSCNRTPGLPPRTIACMDRFYLSYSVFVFSFIFFVSVPSASLSSHLVSLWQLVCQLESSCQNFSVRICHRYSSSDRNTHTTLSLWFLITSFAHVPKKYTVSYRIGMDCRVTTSPVMIMNCNI